MRVFSIGHGTRPLEEFLACLQAAGVRTLVDVRRFPGSRRNPQFNQGALAESLREAGIEYRHEIELGGRRHGEPDEERFDCIRSSSFRSYVARMRRPEWQAAADSVAGLPSPCVMCAETLPAKCHRLFVSDYLLARGHEVVHLIRPHEARPHRLSEVSEARSGALYVCGELVG